MSALDAIAVKVVGGADPASGNATALLHEAAKLLDAFVQCGEPGSIDLRSLPLTSGDYDELRGALGTGAVFARVDAIGPSELRETRYPGIWWVTHFNEAGEIVAELIEIGSVPQILLAPIQDVADGLSGFREALANAPAPKD